MLRIFGQRMISAPRHMLGMAVVNQMGMAGVNQMGVRGVQQSVNEIRTGATIEDGGKLYTVVSAKHTQAGRGRAHVQLDLKDLKDGTKKSMRVRSGDSVEVTEVRSNRCQFLYAQGETLHFLDPESLETFELNKNLAENIEEFLIEGLDLRIQLNGDIPVGLVLPMTMNLKVKETSMPVGDTTKFKHAVLETGTTISVPDYILAGEIVTIRTEDKSFAGRA